MYFSEELKFAKQNGYIVKVKWGYNFERVSNVFTSYVKNLYTMKSKPTNVTQKYLSKSLLNYLYGRYGMDFNKSITKIVDKKTYNELCLTRKITSTPKYITNDDILLTYSCDIDESICNNFNIDINKVIKDEEINKSSPKRDKSFKGVSIPIAAAITAYGRIHINSIKLFILNKGGEIYYSDTDSIVTNIELPQNLVDPIELGKLKLEYKVTRGYFISSKTYCLITKDNKKKFVAKCKGITKNILTEKDFIDMYNGKVVDTYVTHSVTDYTEGSVVIEDKEISLTPDNYTKRTKIYSDNK